LREIKLLPGKIKLRWRSVWSADYFTTTNDLFALDVQRRISLLPLHSRQHSFWKRRLYYYVFEIAIFKIKPPSVVTTLSQNLHNYGTILDGVYKPLFGQMNLGKCLRLQKYNLVKVYETKHTCTCKSVLVGIQYTIQCYNTAAALNLGKGFEIKSVINIQHF